MPAPTDIFSVTALLHDFQAPTPLPGAAGALKRALTDAAPRIGLALGAASRRPFVIGCAGVDRVQSRVLARGGVSLSVLDLGLTQPGLLVVPDSLAVALADVAMGGPGKLVERRPTTLEERLVRRHLGAALGCLATALRPFGVERVVVLDSGPDAAPAELVALRLTISLAGGMDAAQAVVGLPISLVKTVDLPTQRTLGSFGDVSVEISMQLAPTTMSAAEVEELHLGDVIRLEQGPDSPVIGTLGSLPVLLAQLGRRGSTRAVVVHQVLEEM